MQERLTIEDVKRLLEEPTADVRAVVAKKVAAQFGNVVLTPRERELGLEILNHLVHDVAIRVRLALADALANLENAPHGVMLALAHDLDEVASSVLENSMVLTDEDLVELVLSGSTAKQCLIAARPSLGPGPCEAIAEKADRSAVVVLIANDGMIIRPDILEKIVTRYHADEGILDPVARRHDVPPALVERLVTAVSGQLRDHLIRTHDIDPETASLVEDQARERTTVEMMATATPNEVSRLVIQLAQHGRLTPSLVLRAACAGEMDFVETVFARLTEVPLERVRRLIRDVGALGFRAVYARAGFPEVYYPAFRAALDAMHEIEGVGAHADEHFLRRRMLERIAPFYSDVEAEDIGLLLDRITRRTRALPWRAHAA